MRVAVVGGGIQGLCVALEFARQGADVHLFERNDALMRGASRENEGKIHLGYVYANDPGFATARLMCQAAMRFAPLLREHLERDLSFLTRSDPFLYAVHARSLLSTDELESRYASISSLLRTGSRNPDADYFGVRRPESMRRLSTRELRQHFDDASIHGAFESSEIAIDPRLLATALVERTLAEPRITLRCGVAVQQVTPRPHSVRLDGEPFDHVVNCAWCGRLALDETAGLPRPRSWSFRRKYFLRLPPSSSHSNLRSTTVVLGGFGDLVRYDSGGVFLSWYPASCLGIETVIVPACEPAMSESSIQSMREGIRQGLGALVPALSQLPLTAYRESQLASGIIFALGDTDVDDRRSRLHERHASGPQSYGRYHSVDTGKLTTAPLFARQLVSRICTQRNAA